MSIAWRPFLLRPNTPLEGTPKAPDTPDNPRVGTRMKQAGAAVGIDFTGKCDRAPNSVGAHTLIKFLEGKPGQNQLAEILFRQVSVFAKDPGLTPTPNEPPWPSLDPRPTAHGPRHTTHDPRPTTQYFTDGLYPDNENLRAAAEELLEGGDSPDLDLDAAMAFVESANERKVN